METATKLKAFILGASGAIGRELVDELIKSKNWSQITVVVRRKLEEWDKLNDEEKSKLQIILKEDLDCLQDPSQWNLTGYNSVFCCLGTQLKVGKELFVKVDKTYPIYGGQLAAHFKVPHYSLVSSGMANPNSWYFYLKIKGEAEEGLKALKLPHLSIFQAGLLLNRRNDARIGEKLLSFVPFLPKIEAKDVAKALRIEAELQAKTPKTENIVTYVGDELHTIVKTENYPKQK